MSRMRRFVLLVLAVVLATTCGGCLASPGTEVSLPVQPVDTTVPLGTGPPPVSDAAHAAGFIDVRTVVTDAVIDLRY
ncbi:MAG: D-alanyl-D-alanine dipeptidase, partial [Mycobacterium sp.]